MIKHLEHIGIAVKSLKESSEVFKKLFNDPAYKTEEVSSEGVKTQFYKVGNVKVELLEATSPDSAISKFINKKGEGVHHLAFEVDNIKQEMKRLKKQGFSIINDAPKNGADNKSIFFLHPKSTNSVLIELCQEKS